MKLFTSSQAVVNINIKTSDIEEKEDYWVMPSILSIQLLTMGIFCGVADSTFLRPHSWPLAWPLRHDILTEVVVFREELEISKKPKP